MVTARSTQDYERIAAQHPDRRFELIHGEVVEKMPTQLHAYIVHVISGLLFIYLRAQPIGYALVEARFRVPDDDTNHRIPDLAYISRDKGPLRSQGAAPYMPDLAVEVQSPDQSDAFMVDKARYYLANGTRMVWLIYPDRRLAEVLTADTRHLLTEAGVIDGADLLPGFTLSVRELFPDDLPTDGG